VLSAHGSTTLANADGQQADKEATSADGVLTLLRKSRALQVLLLITLAANLTSGGLSDVALVLWGVSRCRWLSPAWSSAT
jgi:hypothetical protein